MKFAPINVLIIFSRKAINISSLAFVRSGCVNLAYGQARVVGEYGYGWSRTAVSATSAYALNSNPTDVYPSGSNSRWNGFFLRCLYPGNA